MAEALVKTIKRDYARFASKPNARAVPAQPPSWFAHSNALHPHKALGYRSPQQFIADKRSTQETALSDL
jgi:putative transposase